MRNAIIGNRQKAESCVGLRGVFLMIWCDPDHGLSFNHMRYDQLPADASLRQQTGGENNAYTGRPRLQ